MALLPVPLPAGDPIARPPRPELKGKDPLAGHLTDPWLAYFTQQGQAITDSPIRINSAQLIDQSATIVATDLSGASVTAGDYRVTWYARITQAATTSSSLIVTLSWTDGGVTPSYAGSAITGNTVTTVQSDTFLMRSDAVAPIRYATTYVSVGGTPMKYALSLIIERVRA